MARGRTSRASRSGISRILVGVRLEPRLVKVMKGLSELHDCALGELIEMVVWNAMDGGNVFAEKGKIPPDVRQRIQNLKDVYGVNYSLDDLVHPKSEPLKE